MKTVAYVLLRRRTARVAELRESAIDSLQESAMAAWLLQMRVRESRESSVHVSEKAVNFHLWGMRYRKDGLPGKRQESLVLTAENDLEQARIGRERRSN